MQENPGKQKLTGSLIRGFWIRECAHFHPVGQSPGGMSSRSTEDEGRRISLEEITHGWKLKEGNDSEEGQRIQT